MSTAVPTTTTTTTSQWEIVSKSLSEEFQDKLGVAEIQGVRSPTSGASYFNTTNIDVNVMTCDGNVVHFPPCGVVSNVKTTAQKITDADGIQIFKSTYGNIELQNLQDIKAKVLVRSTEGFFDEVSSVENNERYIASVFVTSAYKERTGKAPEHIFSPKSDFTAVRGPGGQIQHVLGLLTDANELPTFGIKV